MNAKLRNWFGGLAAAVLAAIVIAGPILAQPVNPLNGGVSPITVSQVCFNGSSTNCFTESGNIVIWGGASGIQATTLRSTSDTAYVGSYAGINIIYASNATGKWQLLSNISAANAGATGATAAVQVQPANALDAADYVFCVNNNAATCLFSVTHSGNGRVSGTFQAVGNAFFDNVYFGGSGTLSDYVTTFGGPSSITSVSSTVPAMKVQPRIALDTDDLFLALRTSAGGDLFLVDTEGDVTSSGRENHLVDADTIADNGAGSNATYTLTPTSSYVELTCSDAHGCDITMGETGVAEGTRVCIVSLTGAAGASENNFADTAGVSELAGAFAAETNDTICLLYTGATWVESSRSNN